MRSTSMNPPSYLAGMIWECAFVVGAHVSSPFLSRLRSCLPHQPEWTHREFGRDNLLLDVLDSRWNV